MTTPPLHLDLNANFGDITCCTGDNCCISNSGGGTVNINQNTAVSKTTNTNNALEDDDPKLIDSEKTTEIAEIPEKIQKMALLYDSRKKKLTPSKKKLTSQQNRATISSYFEQNNDAYGAKPMALLAAFRGIDFAAMFKSEEEFRVKIDVEIQKGRQVLQPLMETINKIFTQIEKTAKFIETENMNTITEQIKELTTDEEPQVVSQAKDKLEKKQEPVHDLFINVLGKISFFNTKEAISGLDTKLKKIALQGLKKLKEIADTMVTLKKDEAIEMIHIAKVVQAVWKENECENLKSTLEIMNKMKKNDLLQLVF